MQPQTDHPTTDRPPGPPGPVPVLEMRGISKTFPGVKALTRVDLTVYPGEVHALMGENGAGKSTLMKVLSGAYQADAGGTIRLDGREVTIGGPLAAKQLGIAVIYQELSLSPNLTVAENIYLGREPKSGPFVDRKAMLTGCAEVLKRLGASFRPTTVVGTLSIAERQLVEIARAIHAEARILVMDEPTTALSARETDRLFELIRRLRTEGLAIIYISHRMAEIYELADRVSVLRDGSQVGTLDRAGLSAEVRPTTTDRFPRPAERPKYSVLSPASLGAYQIRMPDWQDGLTRYLEEREKYAPLKREMRG